MASFRRTDKAPSHSLQDYKNPSFVQQYILGVARDFLLKDLSATVESDAQEFIRKFKPIDVSVVIDNLITNAKKAKATTINFNISHPNKDSVHIIVTDNGNGFDKGINDLSEVFGKGFTRTEGSGLGLHHVKHVLGEMNGTIEAKRIEPKGAMFIIIISK